MPAMKALLFDVFGTCVDWRSSVARAGEELGRRLGNEGVDWAAVADAWRARYQPQLETVRSGARPWVNLDVLHREALDDVLAELGLDVPAPEKDAFTGAWHRLDPWPDTVDGLTRLKRRYVIAPVSNGHIALIVNMAKHAGLPWDAVLGAEIAHAYKPQPEVYLASVAALGLEPAEATIVAAHDHDLEAAQALGLGTAFVARPREHGAPRDATPQGAYDHVATDLSDLAVKLDA
jgi:2-haloacid dehalogenase